MKKLAIITTHPIQYNAPVFKLLTERKKIHIKVFYTWESSKNGIFDKKFGKAVKWDIPLLEGYEYQFVKNISKDQGTHHFKGMINPGLNIEIETWAADAIMIYGWSFSSHFKAMKHFKGRIPVYFRGDSHLLDEKPGLKTILRRLWLRYVYRFIDFAFYVGYNNEEYYLKHGLKDKQLIFAPHAIDNKRFNDEFDDITKSKKWRNELNLEQGDIVFLYAGKFEPKKDPLILIDAANQLRSDHYKFIFAGNGELEEEMKKKAKENRNIIFLPFQNQSIMPVLYRLGDVFVLPSKGPNETWGLAVNEAMACGKPVLVSDKIGCAVDLVRDGENGYIFSAESLDDLINRIKLFKTENMNAFGQRSLEIIKDYNFVNICETVENALNR